MNRMMCATLVTCVLGSTMAFGAKDSAWKVQNSVRVGYDDNIYMTSLNEKGTAFITDIINISGDFVFTDRTALILYWQPEFRYRFEADPDFVSYQDLYANLNHRFTERASIEISDRFRYQEKDGRSDLGETTDQNFLENDLQGAFDYSVSRKGLIRVGAGYEFRVWDDDFYGKGDRNNNYDQYSADGSYMHLVRKETTYALGGINYVNHEYAGNRGGFNSTTIYGGMDHNFNPNMIGTARLGYSFSDVDSYGSSQDATSPYLQAGLDYKASERTSYNGSFTYSLSQSENSVYNASDAFNLGLGAKHDLTGKISLSGTIRYIYSMYDSAWGVDNGFLVPGVGFIPVEDAKEDFLRFSIRGSYQITRNNFVDLGYEYSLRDSDSVFLQQFKRNRVDLGWRLRF